MKTVLIAIGLVGFVLAASADVESVSGILTIGVLLIASMWMLSEGCKKYNEEN